jgi:ribonuclease P protein component
LQRLKVRAQYQAVLSGKLIAKTHHFALHCCEVIPSGTSTLRVKPALFPVRDAWLGAMVPKRWAKRAVTRNAIKRQIYGVASELEQHFPLAAFVVRLRCEFSRREFVSADSRPLKHAVHLEIRQLLEAGIHAA